MAPDRLRKHWRFALLASAPFTLMTAVPAFAQGASTANLGGIVPVAVVLGAGGFALVAVTLLRKLLRDGRMAQRQARGQIADLRALVDDYENLIGGSRELTIIWPESQVSKLSTLCAWRPGGRTEAAWPRRRGAMPGCSGQMMVSSRLPPIRFS